MTRARKRLSSSVPAELIDAIGGQLARGTKVRRKLAHAGRVHIDRQLPFLAVYRAPAQQADPGTERLLLGEASYLLAAGGGSRDAGLTDLLRTIVRTQKQAFGAFLLLELWAAQPEAAGKDQEPGHPRPAFRIHAPRRGVPSALLESIEEALLEISVAGQSAIVDRVHEDSFAPPGMRALLTRTDLERLGCTTLGLEVRPVYRDPDSGELHPFELRELHHALANALKKGFYTFTHLCTQKRPAHYHQLGRRAMTTAVRETDRRLAEISNSFDILLHVTPTNTDAAFAGFRRRRFERMPEFHYRPRQADPALLKRRLYQIPLERIEDPTLAYIFDAKRDELDRQITLLADRCTSRFLHGSLQIYGTVEPRLLELAGEILERLPPHTHDANASHSVKAGEFARRAQAELDAYREVYPELPSEVRIRDDVAGVLVSQGHLLVSSHMTVPASRVMATISHEVGTHIVTYFNGRAQPFQQLYAGMANYEPLQEGLAVLAEYLVGELGRPRLRLLAGRVIAADCIIRGADFVETYRELHDRYDFNQSMAFMTTMRIFRGGGYTKDVVYLRGLVALLEYLAQGGDLELLYLGKVAMEYVPFIEELRWRRVLNESLLRPRYLDYPGAEARRERLAKGLSVLELTGAES